MNFNSNASWQSLTNASHLLNPLPPSAKATTHVPLEEATTHVPPAKATTCLRRSNRIISKLQVDSTLKDRIKSREKLPDRKVNKRRKPAAVSINIATDSDNDSPANRLNPPAEEIPQTNAGPYVDLPAVDQVHRDDDSFDIFQKSDMAETWLKYDGVQDITEEISKAQDELSLGCENSHHNTPTFSTPGVAPSLIPGGLASDVNMSAEEGCENSNQTTPMFSTPGVAPSLIPGGLASDVNMSGEQGCENAQPTFSTPVNMPADEGVNALSAIVPATPMFTPHASNIRPERVHRPSRYISDDQFTGDARIKALFASRRKERPNNPLTMPPKSEFAMFKSILEENIDEQFTIVTGHTISNAHFLHMATSQSPLETQHMQVIMSMLWRRRGSLYLTDRIAFIDTWFTTLISSAFNDFLDCQDPANFSWGFNVEGICLW